MIFGDFAMISVFISYSHKDKRFVNNLSEYLKRYGASIWKDDPKIELGNSIIGEIGKGLNKVDFAIIVLTPDSAKSNIVNKEINIAITLEVKRKLKVIPLLLKDCEIPTPLEDIKYADFRKPHKRKEMLNKLLHRLGLVFEPMPEDIKELIDKIYNLDVYGLHTGNDLWTFNTYLINNLLYNIFGNTYAFDSYLMYFWSNKLLQYDNELVDRVSKYISNLKKEQKLKFDELPELWKRWENMEISIGNAGLGIENTDLKLTKEKVIQLMGEVIDQKFIWKLGGFAFDDFFKDYWEKYKDT